MIFTDLDGTIMAYNRPLAAKPMFNNALLETWRDQEIWIVTNQGGLPFGLREWDRIQQEGIRIGVTPPRKYRTPEEWVSDMIVLERYSKRFGIKVKGVSVCVYHPSAHTESIRRAATRLRLLLVPGLRESVIQIYDHARFRKPLSDMFMGIPHPLESYYGDSEEDAIAARGAEIPFIKVERFMGVEHVATDL